MITLHSLWRILAEGERADAVNTGTIDRKTVDRLVSTLEKEKVVQTFKLALPQLSGRKSYGILFILTL